VAVDAADCLLFCCAREQTDGPEPFAGHSGRSEWSPADQNAGVHPRAWQLAAPAMLDASRAGVWARIGTSFAAAVEAQRRREQREMALKVPPPRVSESKGASGGSQGTIAHELGQEELSVVLDRLLSLHVLSRCRELQAAMSTCGALTAAEASALPALHQAACARVRPDAVTLVDAFGLRDSFVHSPLGRFDGDVYRHYLLRAAQAPGATDVHVGDLDGAPVGSPSQSFFGVVGPLMEGRDLARGREGLAAGD